MLRVLFAIVLIFLNETSGRADQFDLYQLPTLTQAIKDGQLKEVKQLSTVDLANYLRVLTDANSAMLVVETNDRRFCKVLVQPGRQKLNAEKQVPMLFVQKFVTFKEGTERTVRVSGTDRSLFPGTRLHLDFGQVVPEKLGGDLIVEEAANDPLSFVVKPLDKAKLYVLEKPVTGLEPKRAEKLVIGREFEAKYFNGKFKLQADGRRSGELTLLVSEAGEVTGSFYSDKDGMKYDIKGKIGKPNHSISFTVKYPQTEEIFTGMMFTGTGKFIAGTSRLQERETAFIAERVEE
jgi:hypothetical protein